MGQWRTGMNEPVEDVVQTIRDILRGKPEMVVHIGTDGQETDKKLKRVRFSTCVVLYTPTKGGRILHKSVNVNHIHSLQQKLFQEVQYSLEIALELSQYLDNKIMCVHIDANPDVRYPSSKYVQQLAGWVAGQGYEVLVKPDSWCATHAADHVVKQKLIVPQ